MGVLQEVSSVELVVKERIVDVMEASECDIVDLVNPLLIHALA